MVAPGCLAFAGIEFRLRSNKPVEQQENFVKVPKSGKNEFSKTREALPNSAVRVSNTRIA